jgi:hypothetical protein
LGVHLNDLRTMTPTEIDYGVRVYLGLRRTARKPSRDFADP